MPDQPKVTKPALDIPVPSTTDNENILASKKSGEANPLIFFDINVGPEFLGRLIIELYKDVAPKTCENFRQLANGTAKGRNGQQLHYKNSIFHRVINRFMIQGNVFMANTNLERYIHCYDDTGGDFENADGTGGESIYGEKFEDENFLLKHEGAGLVSDQLCLSSLLSCHSALHGKRWTQHQRLSVFHHHRKLSSLRRQARRVREGDKGPWERD